MSKGKVVEMDTQETINHCNIMANKKTKENEAKADNAMQSVWNHRSYRLSGSTEKYRNSSFWDAIGK